MDNNPQASQTDFLYTLATNGQFMRIARYLASNDAVAVRRGAAGILTEFAGDLESAATNEFTGTLVTAVLTETDEVVRARVIETLLYIDESIIDTLVTRIASDNEPTPTDSPHPLVLVEWMGSQHAELRLLAVAGLGDVGAPNMIPRLAAACSDNDQRVRERALKELGRIGSARAIDAVADCLDSDIGTIRWEAARALAEIGTDGALDHLMPAARTDDEELREIVLSELGAFGSDRALDTIVSGLSDDEPEIRQAAASSLIELVWSASFEESHNVREEVAQAIEELEDEDQDVVTEFVTLFSETPRTAIRRNTAWLLGRIGDSRDAVIDTLLDALADEDLPTAQIAASSLARIGGRGIEDDVEAYIQSQPEESARRARAEFVLSQITDSEADVILKRTVEYIHVTEPEDYTRQKAENDETESEDEPIPEESELEMDSGTETDAETEDEDEAADETESDSRERLGYGDRF